MFQTFEKCISNCWNNNCFTIYSLRVVILITIHKLQTNPLITIPTWGNLWIDEIYKMENRRNVITPLIYRCEKWKMLFSKVIKTTDYMNPSSFRLTVKHLTFFPICWVYAQSIYRKILELSSVRLGYCYRHLSIERKVTFWR